jgi:hypothetical protein
MDVVGSGIENIRIRETEFGINVPYHSFAKVVLQF